MRTNFFLLLFAGFLFAFTAGCKKDKETVNNPVFNLRGNANGAQETPNRIATTATGNISGTYDKSTNVLTYTISWTGLTGGNIVGMHFHGPADPGLGASVVVPITNYPQAATGSVSGTANLDDTQEADLVNGLWYYNIHTTAYTPGEIRGQVFLTQ